MVDDKVSFSTGPKGDLIEKFIRCSNVLLDCVMSYSLSILVNVFIRLANLAVTV